MGKTRSAIADRVLEVMSGWETPGRKAEKSMAAWLKCRDMPDERLWDLLNDEDRIIRSTAAARLQMRGGTDTLERALALSDATGWRLRETAVFILGQIALPERADAELPARIMQILLDRARQDKSAKVRAQAVLAVGHRLAQPPLDADDIEDKNREETEDDAWHAFDLPARLAPVCDDASPLVREALASTLCNVRQAESIPLLMALLGDENKDIRNWAAFAVNQTRQDSPELRNVLITLLDDAFLDAREEAICALALHRDPRVVPVLIRELRANVVNDTMIEAAGNLGDPALLPVLQDMLARFDDSDGLIASNMEKIRRFQS